MDKSVLWTIRNNSSWRLFNSRTYTRYALTPVSLNWRGNQIKCNRDFWLNICKVRTPCFYITGITFGPRKAQCHVTYRGWTSAATICVHQFYWRHAQRENSSVKLTTYSVLWVLKHRDAVYSGLLPEQAFSNGLQRLTVCFWFILDRKYDPERAKASEIAAKRKRLAQIDQRIQQTEVSPTEGLQLSSLFSFYKNF